MGMYGNYITRLNSDYDGSFLYFFQTPQLISIFLLSSCLSQPNRALIGMLVNCELTHSLRSIKPFLFLFVCSAQKCMLQRHFLFSVQQLASDTTAHRRRFVHKYELFQLIERSPAVAKQITYVLIISEYLPNTNLSLFE